MSRLRRKPPFCTTTRRCSAWIGPGRQALDPVRQTNLDDGAPPLLCQNRSAATQSEKSHGFLGKVPSTLYSVLLFQPGALEPCDPALRLLPLPSQVHLDATCERGARSQHRVCGTIASPAAMIDLPLVECHSRAALIMLSSRVASGLFADSDISDRFPSHPRRLRPAVTLGWVLGPTHPSTRAASVRFGVSDVRCDRMPAHSRLHPSALGPTAIAP